jgi:guanine nucleotide-binding protein G(I)/G(S)/G(T) subunit beta-1
VFNIFKIILRIFTDEFFMIIRFFPSGYAFASASEDSSCRLFDIRASRELKKYQHSKRTNPANRVTFSKSGRAMFVVNDTKDITVWDTIKGEKVGKLAGHTSKVSDIAISADGYALASSSWDTHIRVSIFFLSVTFATGN